MKIRAPGPEFKNPNRENLSEKAEKVIIKILSLFIHIKVIVRILATLGSFFEFVYFVQKKFGEERLKVYSSREKLYFEMMQKVAKGDVVCCEFGVAWGYTSAFWLMNVTNKDLRWIGFDRFEGLPRDWQGQSKGAFSTDSVTPKLEDFRVSWVKGDVEKTFTPSIIQDLEGFNQRIFFFDFDIFEPSMFVLEQIKPKLRKGDLLYFDEARMIDERFLINNFLFPNIRLNILGITVNAIAFQVK